jgi:hypothetical protein
MKTLLKISKLIPRLGTDNEHEKMATLLMIEKLFKLENISWTDVGLHLADFLTSTLGFVEAEVASPAPAPQAPQTGWQSAQGVHQSSAGRGFSTPGAGASPFSYSASQATPRQAPRRPTVDRRCFGTLLDKHSVAKDIITRKLWQNSREENAIISIEQQLGFGIALTPKQQKVLETLSKRL